MENQPQRPPNYLAVAIITMILCCIPLGIVGVVYSTKVNSAYDRGDYHEAERASRNAKTWVIVTAVAGIIANVAIFALGGLAFFGALVEGGY